MKSLTDTNKCYIIAEISCNHNGSLEKAKEIIRASKESGADAVKLQTYTADTITRDFKNKPLGTMWEKMDLYELYQKAYTPWEWQKELKKEAELLGMDLLSSPFDETSVDFLIDELDVPILKVASFEAVDIKLLQKMARTGRPILISNGMMEFSELKEAVDTLKSHGASDITILQCNSGYPALFSEAHLATIPVMAEIFNCCCGVSDHTLFFDTKNYLKPMPHVTPLEAVKLGAKVVEAHIQINREESRKLMEQGLGGFDWAFSREPEEFKKMVDCIRKYESESKYEYSTEEEKTAAKLTQGHVKFEPTEKERASLAVRPSLWAVKSIKKGTPFIFAAEKKPKRSRKL